MVICKHAGLYCLSVLNPRFYMASDIAYILRVSDLKDIIDMSGLVTKLI